MTPSGSRTRPLPPVEKKISSGQPHWVGVLKDKRGRHPRYSDLAFVAPWDRFQEKQPGVEIRDGELVVAFPVGAEITFERGSRPPSRWNYVVNDNHSLHPVQTDRGQELAPQCAKVDVDPTTFELSARARPAFVVRLNANGGRSLLQFCSTTPINAEVNNVTVVSPAELCLGNRQTLYPWRVWSIDIDIDVQTERSLRIDSPEKRSHGMLARHTVVQNTWVPEMESANNVLRRAIGEVVGASDPPQGGWISRDRRPGQNLFCQFDIVEIRRSGTGKPMIGVVVSPDCLGPRPVVTDPVNPADWVPAFVVAECVEATQEDYDPSVGQHELDDLGLVRLGSDGRIGQLSGAYVVNTMALRGFNGKIDSTRVRVIGSMPDPSRAALVRLLKDEVMGHEHDRT